jgi:Dna[CI] antecedent, DciA
MEPSEDDYLIEQLQAQSKSVGPHAKSIRSVMKSLLVKRGITDEQSSLELEEAWRRAAPAAVASETRVGRMYRGSLTIWVKNNSVLQELDFSKSKILATLKTELPHLKLRDVRFRVDG